MTRIFSNKLLTLLGLLLILGAFITIYIVDQPLSDRMPVTFMTSDGDSLSGTYYPGSEPKGVILLEGFGSDQVTMTTIAREFAYSNWHIFTFDFSGHGRSPGKLTFDNSQTDRLAQQILSAMETFKELSGLRTDQVYMIGHSLGARVALQSATINSEKVAGLVLLGTQVNLSTNVQSEFFTGTIDTTLPWVQALGPDNPSVPILLVSGVWDDIITPENAEKLFSQLGGDKPGSNRKLVILPAVVHNYEPFSFQVLSVITKWINGFLPIPNSAIIRMICWIFGLAGIMMMLSFGNQWQRAINGKSDRPIELELIDVKRFLWGKLLLWLGAFPIAAIIAGLFFLIPLPKPVFNLIYVGFISGYGTLLLVLYWRGKMPGVKGKLPFVTIRAPLDWKQVIFTLGISIGVFILIAIYTRTGWFYTFPLNVRLLWLIIFTPFTALGFWIGLHEAQMLPQTHRVQIANILIGLFPFFLYSILMGALGSLSGMIGGIQGLIILWIVLIFGNFVQATGHRFWLTAFCMASLLYWLILPQGVLF